MIERSQNTVLFIGYVNVLTFAWMLHVPPTKNEQTKYNLATWLQYSLIATASFSRIMLCHNAKFVEEHDRVA